MAIMIDGATITGGALITGVSGVTTDPSFAYVPLLLNTTSTNGQQNNTFLDSSTNNFTITRNGTPTQGSITPYWPNGQWSNYFNGSTDWLSSTNATTVLQFGSSAYTIEGWVYHTSRPTYSFICGGIFSGTGFQAFINSSGFVVVSVPAIGDLTASTIAIPLNAWTHFAIVRTSTSAGGFTYYINGVAAGTPTDANNYSGTATTFNVATTNNSSLYVLPGYLSNLRIVKGVAVYTGAFTPPTTPLAATQSGNGGTIQAITGTQTAILTCQSNRFLDSSAQVTPATFTVNGTPRVQAFQPFSPTASYTTALYGGSGYFNGSTDYLSSTTATTVFQFGSNPYTVEGWMYLLARPTTQYICGGSFSGNGFQVGIDSSGYLLVSVPGSSPYTSPTIPIPLNAWTHFAIVRTSTSTSGLAYYINGVAAGTATDSTNYSGTATTLQIASTAGGAAFVINTYLSNFRVVKGTAVYTEAFTPPTSPVTAITNTALLLNFTNAGIYDAAVQNDVITVGDAQASSTPTAQWPPTSMKFNGSTDYIIAPTIPSLNGAFTIEFWFYRVGTGSNYCFTIGDAINATGLEVYIGTSGTVFNLWSNNAARITSATTPTASAWNYIAVTRDSSNVIRLYLAGSQVGSTYTSSAAFGTILRLGAEYYNSAITGYCNGSIQDFRITNGVARTITTPTAAFPTQ